MDSTGYRPWYIESFVGGILRSVYPVLCRMSDRTFPRIARLSLEFLGRFDRAQNGSADERSEWIIALVVKESFRSSSTAVSALRCTMTLVDVDLEVEKGEVPPPVLSAVATPDAALNKHTDPFAKREGKTLTWKNVNMTLVRWIQMSFVLWNETLLCTPLSTATSFSHLGGQRRRTRANAPFGSLGRSAQSLYDRGHGTLGSGVRWNILLFVAALGHDALLTL
jgi:hypothetical protein